MTGERDDFKIITLSYLTNYLTLPYLALPYCLRGYGIGQRPFGPVLIELYESLLLL